MAAPLSVCVSRRRLSRGFSLVELLVSIAILTILLVISVPTLMRAYRSYQLGDAASRFSGTLKYTRFSAIRKNTPVACQVQQIGTDWVIWTDSDGDGNPSPGEQQLVVNGIITLLDDGAVPSPAAIIAAIQSAGLNTLSPTNTAVTYDQRGGLKTPNTPSVFYLGNTEIPEMGFRAVVLLPAGTVQVWTAPPGGPWQRVS